MKQEDELLFKDLCARLPYGIKIEVTYSKHSGSSLRARLCSEGINTLDTNILWLFQQSEIYIKPYLFPLSSMTEEQEEEYGKYYDIDLINGTKNLYDRLDGKNVLNGYPMYNHIDWLNKNHFDYRGLIPLGLANDATGLNIY